MGSIKVGHSFIHIRPRGWKMTKFCILRTCLLGEQALKIWYDFIRLFVPTIEVGRWSKNVYLLDHDSLLLWHGLVWWFGFLSIPSGDFARWCCKIWVREREIFQSSNNNRRPSFMPCYKRFKDVMSSRLCPIFHN